MSEFERFMRKNKTMRSSRQYAPTNSLTDESGAPLMWTIRPLSTKECSSIREECTEDIPVRGKSNVYRQRLNTEKYIAKTLCACIEYPNLYDKALQDSYGVLTPEELLVAMVDDPDEYNAFVSYIQENSSMACDINDEVKTAKK